MTPDQHPPLIRARTLPECPEGANPFKWIVATAPAVREQRQAEQNARRLTDHTCAGALYGRQEAA